MPYWDHFQHADEVVQHRNGVVPGIGGSDPLLAAKYAGFIAVAGVTVYELAIREIFTEFARKKHKVFGCFVDEYFGRINGRIRLEVVRKEYIAKFGNVYQERFQKKIEKKSQERLMATRRDIRAAYGNLIVWRNQFAHKGQMNSTYSEAVQAYEDGKNVVHCLADCMKR